MATWISILLLAFAPPVDWFAPQFSFSRPSSATVAGPTALVETPPDVPQHRSVLACSISDGSFAQAEGYGGGEVIPQCRNSRYMFGAGGGRIYRSSDGRNWSVASGHTCVDLFTMADDSLLVFYFNGSSFQADRSTDDGVTWTATQWSDGSGIFKFLTPNAKLMPFGLWQAQNGTVIAAEYLLPYGGRYLYRSMDSGATWTTVNDNNYQVTHHHAVVKHEGLGRWIVDTGDGAPREELLASDDDGLTWYAYSPLGHTYTQPTYLMDVGDPERLLFGSDLAWQAGWLNVSDSPRARQIDSVITNWNRSDDKNLCFLMARHDGLVYACNYEDSNPNSGAKNAVISVSADYEHWAVYHRFTQNEIGPLRYAGFIGGRLHFSVQDNAALEHHFSISPAGAALTPATVVSPDGSNLLNRSGDGDCESTANWLNLSQPGSGGGFGVLTTGANRPLQGQRYVTCSRSDTGSILILSPQIATQVGQTFQARFSVRGDAAACQFNWSTGGTRIDNGQNHALFGLNPNAWLEVVTPAVTVAPGWNGLRLAFSAAPHPDTGSCRIEVDAIQIEPVLSTPWVAPGQLRAPTVRSAAPGQGPQFAHVFTVEPDSMSEYWFGAGILCLASYSYDAGNQLELDFNGATSRFELRATVAGVPQPTLSSSPQHFQQRAHLRLGVVADTTQARLAIANGQPLEIDTMTLAASLPDSALTLAHAAVGTHRAFPGAYFNEAFTGNAVSPADLAAAMSRLSALCDPPTLTIPPADQVVCAGDAVCFTVAASGEGPLYYQWRKDGQAIAGAISPQLQLTAVASADAGSYDCVVETDCGTVCSAAAALTVDAVALTQGLAEQRACLGSAVTFQVVAAGRDLTYQWSKDDAPIGGAETDTLVLSPITSDAAGEYRCDVRGACGAAFSSAALSVEPPLMITQDPQPQSVVLGGAAAFSTAASGAELQFQWRRNGVPLNGATAAVLSLANVALYDEGVYDCIISNRCEARTTAPAPLLLLESAQIGLRTAFGSCFASPDFIEVAVYLNAASTPIMAGEFHLNYDAANLQFLGALPGDPPLSSLTLAAVDPQAGTIDFSVASADGGGAAAACTLARLDFALAPNAAACRIPNAVNFGPGNQASQLSDALGTVLSASAANLQIGGLNSIRLAGIGPTITAPPDINLVLAPPAISAVIAVGAASAWEACDGTLPVGAQRSDGLGLAAAYPAGDTDILWSAVDSCGFLAQVNQHVHVYAGWSCLADMDGNGMVSLSDLALLLANYGLAGGNLDAHHGDLNDDHIVDLHDLTILISVYGTSCM